MPYKTVNDLPASVKDHLPKHAREIFLAAFTSAMDQYKEEKRAFRVAWSAVKAKYRRAKDGTWHLKERHLERMAELASTLHAVMTKDDGDGDELEPSAAELTEQMSPADAMEVAMAHERKGRMRYGLSELSRLLLCADECGLTADEQQSLAGMIARLARGVAEDVSMTEAINYAAIQDAIESLMIEDVLQEAGQRHSNEEYQLFDQALDLLKRLRGHTPQEVKAERDRQAEEAEAKANSPEQQMLDGYHGTNTETVAITESHQDGELIALKETITFLQESGAEGRAWKVSIIEAGVSKNDRLYSLDVLRKAAPLFEGARCYAYDRTLKGKPIFDHLSDDEYRVNPMGYSRDLIGVITEPMIEGSRLVGTLRLLPSADWLRDNLRYLAEKGHSFPYGLSIDSSGEGHQTESGGRSILHVDAIRQVNSVDLVSHPAAGGGFLRIVASVAIAEAERERETEREQLALIESLGRAVQRMTIELAVREALDELPGSVAEKRDARIKILAVVSGT